MLKTVTITGADNDTDATELMNISKEFPFVEWGILTSYSQEDSVRFPNRDWINYFCHIAFHNNMAISMHMCGKWVRQLLYGDLNWEEVPQTLLATAQRIQINTHAEDHVSRFGMIDKLRDDLVCGKTFIFQWDNINNHLAYAAKASNVKVNVLYDCSHGAGKLPDVWPRATNEFYCGYAGGLGPENVVYQNERIENCTGGLPYWIDMEGRVRTSDGMKLDLAKVRMVLEAMKPFVLSLRD